MHTAHRDLLKQIVGKAGKPKPNPFLDNYLGNKHPKYAINSPTLRGIAREWVRSHKDVPPNELADVLRSLVCGKSCTEKMLAGLLLDSAHKEQRAITPAWLDRYLNHLVGWVEVDTLCTGRYAEAEILNQWSAWRPQLNRFAKSDNIQKRRASLVLLCSPLRKHGDPRLLKQAFLTIDKLDHEKDVLITKAVSWVLRSALAHFPGEVKKYVTLNADRLPKIAVRETMTKLTTGTKTKRKTK